MGRRLGLASLSSHNLPSSCTLVKTETTTRLFTVPDYAKWERMAAGSVLKFDKFSHSRGRYRLKVYPAGFDEESAGYVAIFVDDFRFLRFNPTVKVFIEILDLGGERAVFDNHTGDTARSEQTLGYLGRSKGYMRFVKRRELEACLRADDSLTVRCTLSNDVEVTKKLTFPGGPLAEDTPWDAI